MKREILFRAKSTINDKWVYGDLVQTSNFTSIKEVDGAYIRPVSVNSDTIGQYTGLKDKNGNKIFEGDILKTPNGFIGEVVFGRAEEECTHREYRRKITDVFTTYGWIFKRADGFTIAIDDEILQGELIGNVTDNAELLK